MTPEINAISTIVVVGTAIAVLLATRISDRRARRAAVPAG